MRTAATTSNTERTDRTRDTVGAYPYWPTRLRRGHLRDGSLGSHGRIS
jgi:hypothetical protein